MSRCCRVAVQLVITVLLVAFTVLAFASHFVKQSETKEKIVPEDTETSFFLYYNSSMDCRYSKAELVVHYQILDPNRPVAYLYGGEFPIVYDDPATFSTTACAADLLKGAGDMHALGQAMIAAQFFAALGTFVGFVAVVASALTIFLSVPWLSLVRILLTALAFIFCLVTTAVVAGCFRDKYSDLGKDKIVFYSQYITPAYTHSFKLCAGFALICTAFGGFFILLVAEVVFFACTLESRDSSARAAQQDDAVGDDLRTYGTQLAFTKD